MKELIITQFDAFLTWAGVMFLIYAFFWCLRVGSEISYCWKWRHCPANNSAAAAFFRRLENWRSPLTIEGRCWATIAAATVSVFVSAAWAG